MVKRSLCSRAVIDLSINHPRVQRIHEYNGILMSAANEAKIIGSRPVADHVLVHDQDGRSVGPRVRQDDFWWRNLTAMNVGRRQTVRSDGVAAGWHAAQSPLPLPILPGHALIRWQQWQSMQRMFDRSHRSVKSSFHGRGQRRTRINLRLDVDLYWFENSDVSLWDSMYIDVVLWYCVDGLSHNSPVDGKPSADVTVVRVYLSACSSLYVCK